MWAVGVAQELLRTWHCLEQSRKRKLQVPRLCSAAPVSRDWARISYYEHLDGPAALTIVSVVELATTLIRTECIRMSNINHHSPPVAYWPCWPLRHQRHPLLPGWERF
jgi:hypothetical protein